MDENIVAQNCTLEIGEKTGEHQVTTQVFSHNVYTVEYLGCIVHPTLPYTDEGFNSGTTVITLTTVNRVHFKGVFANPMGIKDMVGVGPMAQGNLLTYIAYFSQFCGGFLNYYDLNPGTGMNANKFVYFDLYLTLPATMASFPSIGAPLNQPGNTDHWGPYNSQNRSDNVAGRALYCIDNLNTTGSGNNCTQRQGIAFDCMASYTSFVLLRGNGSDMIDDYSITSPNFWNSPEDFTWYISAYIHSLNWDSSEGTGNPFYWMGGSLSPYVRTEVGSYEGSKHRDPGLGFKQNECFSNPGFLGLRSSAFSDDAAWGYSGGGLDLDAWELEIDVGQLLNAKITIFEGVPNTPGLPQTPGNDLVVTSVGVHTFCLAALKISSIWGGLMGGSNTGEVILENTTGPCNSGVYEYAEGGITILNAEALDNSQPARITLNYVKLIKREPVLNTITTPVYNTVVSYVVDEIGWNYLDVFDHKSLPLSLTYSISSLKDLSKRAAGFSKTFKIPANNHNCQVLDPMLAVGAEHWMIDWQPCLVGVNGVTVFKGLIRIEKGVTGNGGAFSCHIIEDSIDWTTLLKDHQLCDISIIELDPNWQAKSFNNIYGSWWRTPNPAIAGETSTDFNNNPERHLFADPNFPTFNPIGNPEVNSVDIDYFYGLVNFGDWHAQSVSFNPAIQDYNHNANDFHPLVFAYRIIHKIFNNIGYTLQSNFVESETFKRLCHPWTSGEDYKATDIYGDGGSQYTRVVKVPYHQPYGGGFSGGGALTCGGCYAYYYPTGMTVTNDLGNNWSTNAWNGGYTAPFAGDYTWYVKATMFVSQNWGAANGCHLKLEVCVNGTAQLMSGTYASWPGCTSGCTLDDSWTVTLNAGDHVSVRFEGFNPTQFWGYDVWFDIENIVFNVFPIPSSTIPDYEVDLTKILPCISQMSYLKGITELFNLQWIADKDTKIVTVEPYDDFYGTGKVVDWSEKIDYKTWTDKFIIKELAQSVVFQYKKDGGDKGIRDLYNYREAVGQPIYKSYTEVNNERFRKETLKLGSTVFHSTWRFNNYGLQPTPSLNSDNHYNWGDLTWTDPASNAQNPLMPVIWTSDNPGGSINRQNRPVYTDKPKAGIRILNYYGVRDCSQWNFIDGAGGNHNMASYPYCDWIEGWKKGIAKDDFNLAWHDFNDGNGFVSPGLFTKYWRNAFLKMNGGVALRTCKIALTAQDISLFDYRDLILLQIDGVSTYWTVQAIKDYKPNRQSELTTVELVEFKEHLTRKGE